MSTKVKQQTMLCGYLTWSQERLMQVKDDLELFSVQRLTKVKLLNFALWLPNAGKRITEEGLGG